MVHLPALPGSPRARLALEEIVAAALADAQVLVRAGFPAICVENFGDAPFYATQIEPVTVAAMAIVVREVRRASGVVVGVNCLRNDARSALGVAAVTGAAFFRVNVHMGVTATDQGSITGDAPATLRERKRLAPHVRIFADVHVKHAVPISQPDIGLAAEETAYRGLADALIVTGASTGRGVDRDCLERVREAVPDRPVLVGSGATADTVRDLLKLADGVIVGSSLKPGGRIELPVDAGLAADFMRAAKA
jgi:membrane complex biogenesis BtpA family protein